MELPIRIDKEKIAAFCQAHHIVKLSLFGSVLTEHFRDDSDIDVLVEFDPEHIVTLFDIFDMEEELSKMLARKVDLRTPKELSRYFRDKVVGEALLQYAA